MAVVSMQKVKIVALKKDEKKLLSILQRQGVMEITKIEQGEKVAEVERSENLNKVELNIANLDFAIKLLKPYEKSRGFLEGPLTLSEEEIEKRAKESDFARIVEQCQKIEAEMVKSKNALSALQIEEDIFLPWKKLRYKLDEIDEISGFKIMIGTITKADYDEFGKEIEEISPLQSIEVIGETESLTYVAVVFQKDLESMVREVNIKRKFTVVDLPKRSSKVEDELIRIKKEKSESVKNIERLENELKKLSKESESLKITHDYYVWERDSLFARENFNNTEYTFAVLGWVPFLSLKKLEEVMSKETKNFEILNVDKEEGEDEPVAILNNSIFSPFEAVTKIYGLPLAHEVDPTPFLAGFFIIYFGLCLTDAGYGLVLFILTFAALKWLKIPKESQKLIKLIMVGGIVTFAAGALFGGWFGMTPEQAPGFLTYDKLLESGETVRSFKWQIVNPTEGNGPLVFLIIAAALGIFQVLTGIAVDGYWKIRSKRYLDALLDSALWIAFVSSILLFGLSSGGIIFADKVELFKNLSLIGVGLMVLTQGRKKKGIVMKFLSGVLSLYGLVGYMADVLSYSRLMALGLGTGIIGFAMNTMAGLASGVPYVGIILAIIVLIIGHTLNLGISTLGAYIHSSRLQFVEFFGKFMEGGGREFKAFKKNCKYVVISGK